MQGQEPIVSKNSRIRHPDCFDVGRNSIVDDFCYFSARIRIGMFCHVASGCSVAGGVGYQFTLGDFSSLSSGVKIWCASNDFVDDLVTLAVPGLDIGDDLIRGDVVLGAMSGVGANSVVMPANTIPEGTVVGALSFVPAGCELEAWSVYAGIPVRLIKRRNRDQVLAQRDRIVRELGLGSARLSGEPPS